MKKELRPSVFEIVFIMIMTSLMFFLSPRACSCVKSQTKVSRVISVQE